MTDKPNVDKERLFFGQLLMSNENLTSPRGSDMLITNPMPNPEVRVDIHIHSSFINIIIGDLVKHDIHLPGCNIYNPEYSEVGYYQLFTTPDYKTWHLKRVCKDDFFNLRNAYLLSKIETLNDKTLQWRLSIHNDDFVNSIKEKFSDLASTCIKSEFLTEVTKLINNDCYSLENTRFFSWGKYDKEKEYGKQKYVMSIKFYYSLIEHMSIKFYDSLIEQLAT